jgi:hypothetical protein
LRDPSLGEPSWPGDGRAGHAPATGGCPVPAIWPHIGVAGPHLHLPFEPIQLPVQASILAPSSPRWMGVNVTDRYRPVRKVKGASGAARGTTAFHKQWIGVPKWR